MAILRSREATIMGINLLEISVLDCCGSCKENGYCQVNAFVNPDDPKLARVIAEPLGNNGPFSCVDMGLMMGSESK